MFPISYFSDYWNCSTFAFVIQMSSSVIQETDSTHAWQLDGKVARRQCKWDRLHKLIHCAVRHAAACRQQAWPGLAWPRMPRLAAMPWLLLLLVNVCSCGGKCPCAGSSACAAWPCISAAAVTWAAGGRGRQRPEWLQRRRAPGVAPGVHVAAKQCVRMPP